MASQTQFSFLVTTDNHMGYRQDDHIRRKDSFMAFSEALQIAREREVDFILLGGDLFHVNKPSTSIEHKCIKIIRQHMTSKSDRQATFKRVSGELSHFERLNHANFEDPNLKVQYPIFTIHGNHDDPTGPNAKSVCEKLATCGLLNYFGLVRPDENKDIHVKPVVLQKGEVKIALYGLGFIPDVKLRQAFDNERVHFEKPAEDTFNVLIVHQNRVPHDKRKYIPDELFPKYFHLILRGHEHDTQRPVKLADSKVDGIVYQPGSTVATSISPLESGAKQVAIMSVSVKEPNDDSSCRFSLDYDLVALRCWRPMMFRDISQKEVFRFIKKRDSRKQLNPVEYRNLFKEFVIEYIDNLLQEFELAHSNGGGDLSQETELSQATSESYDTKKSSLINGSAATSSDSNSVYAKLDRFKLPLLRIRLEYAAKSERFDELEVSPKFHPQRVANGDIVLYKRQKLVKNEKTGEMENVTFASETNDDEDELDEVEVINLSEERKDTIDIMIENYFEGKAVSDQLQALSLNEYTNAVRSAVEEGNVISKVLSKKKRRVLEDYEEALGDEQSCLENFHDSEKVRDWFLARFRNQAVQMDTAGGDQYEIALKSALAMQAAESEDSDIMWED